MTVELESEVAADSEAELSADEMVVLLVSSGAD